MKFVLPFESAPVLCHFIFCMFFFLYFILYISLILIYKKILVGNLLQFFYKRMNSSVYRVTMVIKKIRWIWRNQYSTIAIGSTYSVVIVLRSFEMEQTIIVLDKYDTAHDLTLESNFSWSCCSCCRSSPGDTQYVLIS